MSEEIDGKLDKMSEKLDKMSDIMTVIQVSQGKMEVNVAEHIRRTAIAEDNITILRTELEPIKEHVSQVRGITKFAMWLAGGLGALFLAILAYLKK